jgi:TRAP-type C4-dicarboxylate transport system permease small subunit
VTTLLRAYDFLIGALAFLAGAILVVSTVVIIYDVTLRNLLISPPAWTIPFTEYGMLYVTMFTAPWLVRTQGHVMIEVVHHALPDRWRRPLEKFVYVLCILICVVLSGYLVELVIQSWRSGEVVARTIEMPRLWLYAPMLLGFILIGCEFLRFLVGKGSLYHRTSVESAGAD